MLGSKDLGPGWMVSGESVPVLHHLELFLYTEPLVNGLELNEFPKGALFSWVGADRVVVPLRLLLLGPGHVFLLWIFPG